MKILFLTTLIFFSSCAGQENKPPLHLTDGVINMMRSSFVRGCQKAYLEQEISPTLKRCLSLSEDYINEMLPLL